MAITNIQRTKILEAKTIDKIYKTIIGTSFVLVENIGTVAVKIKFENDERKDHFELKPGEQLPIMEVSEAIIKYSTHYDIGKLQLLMWG